MDVKVFISYSSADKGIAEKTCDYLENSGKSCWIAPRNIPAGAEYGDAIIRGIESCDVFVLIFSENSNKSQHVLREVERAVSKNTPIISYRIDNTELSKSMEYFLLTNQWLDTTAGSGKMLKKLDSGIDEIVRARTVPVADTPADFASQKKTSTNTVPIFLGVIAIGIIAIAVILALSFSQHGNGNTSSEIIAAAATTESVPPATTDGSSTETAITPAETTAATEATTATAETSTTTAETSTTTAETTAAVTETSPVTQTTLITTETTPAATENIADLPSFRTGQFIKFGRYYPTGYSDENGDGEIVWQIFDYDAEKGSMRLIAAQIIDIKPFDCAESGDYDKSVDGESYDRNKKDEYSHEQMKQFRGSNEWYSSDLRAWLNSVGKVTYSSISQSNATTDEYGNGFEKQRGFLSSFTEKEVAALLDYETSQETLDKVYVLSAYEAEEYYETGYFDPYSGITKSAIASDETSWYNAYESNGNEKYFWVTRTPVDENSHQVRTVDSSTQEMFSEKNAASSGFGIRPAVLISINGFTVTGDGTKVSPYIIKE